jgi:hypothetical protein
MADANTGRGGRRNKRRGGRSGGQGGNSGGQNRNNGRGGMSNGSGGNKGRRKRKRRTGGGISPRHQIDRLPPTEMDDSSVLGGRVPRNTPRAKQLEGPPDGFTLFAAYHLGVTPEDGYQKPSLDEISKRYGMTHDEVRAALVEHRIDLDTVRESKFDLDGAKLDVRVAPEGISRIEIAREQYDMYLEELEA